MKKKILILIVVFLAGMFFITACEDDKGDTTAPVPGGDNGGKITGGTTLIGGDSVPCTLSWQEATDNTSAAENLEYLLIKAIDDTASTADDYAALMTTFSNYISGINSTAVDTLENDGSVTITGVTISPVGSWHSFSIPATPGAEEFYAVLVRDAAGNIAAYDIYDPRPTPQGNPSLSIPMTGSSYYLNSLQAEDDISGGGLTYTVTLDGLDNQGLSSIAYDATYSISGDAGTYLITVTDGNGFCAEYPENVYAGK